MQQRSWKKCDLQENKCKIHSNYTNNLSEKIVYQNIDSIGNMDLYYGK